MDIGALSGLQPGEIGAVCVGALLFGIAYNAFTAWFNRSGQGEGYTAFLVVGGVLVTLAFAAILIGVTNALWVLAVFGCTGLPMVIGDVHRYTQQRKQATEELRAALLDVSSNNDHKT